MWSEDQVQIPRWGRSVAWANHVDGWCYAPPGHCRAPDLGRCPESIRWLRAKAPAYYRRHRRHLRRGDR